MLFHQIFSSYTILALNYILDANYPIYLLIFTFYHQLLKCFFKKTNIIKIKNTIS